MKETPFELGVDIGSTTVKAALRKDGKTLYRRYERHYARVREMTAELLREAAAYAGDARVYAAISGSAGLGLAEAAGIPFVQEVFATAELVRAEAPDAACVIELGGEDAKIIFFKGGLDQRMNGSCAGGTGAFIDQMATLLNVSVEELDRLSLNSEKIYPIASRCGVFAKTDIQPLVNQGARKEDIAASIYQAVVNQTIAGLLQGRTVGGKVLFLGGPLYYCHGLRARFVDTLGLTPENAVFPEYARFAVAMGAALYAGKGGDTFTMDELIARVENAKTHAGAGRLEPLFTNEAEYAAFRARHARASIPRSDIRAYRGEAYLGVDCGSTTTKLVLVAPDGSILYDYYAPNQGNPVAIVRDQLQALYALGGDRVVIRGSCATGYGEDLVKNAFDMDMGVVETVAHFTAARAFDPEVSFILDIGGQDIKCFGVKNHAIDTILLNEACSSGCGSFLSAFAQSMGKTVEDFAKEGLFAKAPVNLGSRCTVFMNSSVKQAQKDGATLSDISAGLSVSVVKNALYKVICISSARDLGEHVVVQGGTFLNDAVLRAFEREIGREVVRPQTAGLMGAYGAALRAMRVKASHLITREALETFAWTSKPAVCGGCANHCHLTVNAFSGGRKFVAGNRCERGAGQKAPADVPNVCAYKREALAALKGVPGPRGKIGLPLALGMYELLPLWHALFTSLGYEVVVSEPSSRKTYERGQFTIPSDTACYPAKLMHGHVLELIDEGVKAIFYPCLTYNVDEGESDNHYNCPVVAYYSELLHGNVGALKDVKFLYPYLNVGNPRVLARGLSRALEIPLRETRRAVKAGFAAYRAHMADVRAQGERAMEAARAQGRRVMILAGRPYHVDPEVGHGIDQLAASLGFAVVTEDSVSHMAPAGSVRVLNQWTYHARLYRAARFAAAREDTELVQLVSFGCGVDAITTDEVRAILEDRGKLYTQIKIDEITNLGAVKIRLRSLMGALEERRTHEDQLLYPLQQRDEKDAYDSGAQHAAHALPSDRTSVSG